MPCYLCSALPCITACPEGALVWPRLKARRSGPGRPPRGPAGHRPGAPGPLPDLGQGRPPGRAMPHLRGPVPVPGRGHPHGRAGRGWDRPPGGAGGGLHRLRPVQFRLPHPGTGDRGGTPGVMDPGVAPEAIPPKLVAPAQESAADRSWKDNEIHWQSTGSLASWRTRTGGGAWRRKGSAVQLPAGRGRRSSPARAAYVADQRWPEGIPGVTVRSRVAHGRLKAIHFGPGVPWDEVVVVTAKDIAAQGWHNRGAPHRGGPAVPGGGSHQPRGGAGWCCWPTRTRTCWSGPGGR